MAACHLDVTRSQRIFHSKKKQPLQWHPLHGVNTRCLWQDSLTKEKGDSIMTARDNPSDPWADALAQELPYLRRYARALTGSRDRGDTYARVTLETVLADPDGFDDKLPMRLSLFRLFHSIWSGTGGSFDDGGAPAGSDRGGTAHLTSGTREALLLHTIEDLSFAQVGTVMGIDASEAKRLIDIAFEEMAKAAPGKVLVIEDEAIIAADLEEIVVGMGHQVTGVASTAATAVALAGEERPDLILSDMQLADLSSGKDAVDTIQAAQGAMPVVFVTAYPERLLTGSGPEPAFVIAKPYREEQVRSAVSQAMFFSASR